MFKALRLQKLHGLADDTTSFQSIDRRSFRAFLSLTPAADVPDGQTSADFRNALTAAHSFEAIFALFLSQPQADRHPRPSDRPALLAAGDGATRADSACASGAIAADLETRNISGHTCETGCD